MPKPKLNRNKQQQMAKRPGPFGAYGSSIGSMIGNAIAPGIGGVIGSGVGGAAGMLLNKITGSGDYRVNTNTLVSNPVPSFSKGAAGVRIRNREFIRTVDGSTGFDVIALRVNPANKQMFAWLSGIATNFQEYKLHGMIVEYVSKCNDPVTNVTINTGTSIISSQYDVAGAFLPGNPSLTRRYLEQAQYASIGKPSYNLLHAIECDPKQTTLGQSFIYPTILDNTVVANDPRFYDWCITYFTNTALPNATANCGELWVSYDIELLKPKDYGSKALTAEYRLSAVSTAAYFGASPAVEFDNLGVTLAATSITIDRSMSGRFIMLYYLAGGAASVVSPTITPSAGASVGDAYGTGNPVIDAIGADEILYSYSFNCAEGGVLTFSGATLPTGATGYVMVIQLATYQLLSVNNTNIHKTK